MHRGSCCQIHCHCYSTMAPAITTTPTTNDEHRATGAEIRAYGHIAADACDGFIKVETRRLVDPGRAHAHLIHLIHPIVPVHYICMYVHSTVHTHQPSSSLANAIFDPAVREACIGPNYYLESTLVPIPPTKSRTTSRQEEMRDYRSCRTPPGHPATQSRYRQYNDLLFTAPDPA